jgi:hypothetical protein
MMSMSNAERQKRFRQNARHGKQRMEFTIPAEVAIKARYLVAHFGCTQNELLARLLMEEWERQGRPLPGNDGLTDVEDA